MIKSNTPRLTVLEPAFLLIAADFDPPLPVAGMVGSACFPPPNNIGSLFEGTYGLGDPLFPAHGVTWTGGGLVHYARDFASELNRI